MAFKLVLVGMLPTERTLYTKTKAFKNINMILLLQHYYYYVINNNVLLIKRYKKVLFNT